MRRMPGFLTESGFPLHVLVYTKRQLNCSGTTSGFSTLDATCLRSVGLNLHLPRDHSSHHPPRFLPDGFLSSHLMLLRQTIRYFVDRWSVETWLVALQ